MGNVNGEQHSWNDNFLGLESPIPRELIEVVIQNGGILISNSFLQSDWALPSFPLEEIWQYSHEVSWMDLKTRMFWIPLKLLLHLLERLQSSFLLTQVSVLSAFGSYYVLIHILHVGPAVEWMPRILLRLP